MRAWMPVPTTAKGRLVLLALEEFGARGYAGVSVTGLAKRAGVTTGSLYHHFRDKLALYRVVRADVEQRIVDRMTGALEAEASLTATLLVGYDAAVRQGFARLLAEEAPGGAADPISALLGDQLGQALGRVLAAAWREALSVAADGNPEAGRAALADLSVSRTPSR